MLKNATIVQDGIWIASWAQKMDAAVRFALIQLSRCPSEMGPSWLRCNTLYIEHSVVFEVGGLVVLDTLFVSGSEEQGMTNVATAAAELDCRAGRP